MTVLDQIVVVGSVTGLAWLSLWQTLRFHMLVRAAGLPPGVNFYAIIKDRLIATSHWPIKPEHDYREIR